MAPGDVEVQIVAPSTAAVDTAVTAMRTGANDKWGFVTIAGGQQVMIINVEEA